MAYMTVAELREAEPDLVSQEKFPDATLEALVDEFAEIAEQYRGVAFEPTTATETVYTRRDGDAVPLRHRPVRTVTSVTVDGTLLPASGYEVDQLAGAIVVGMARDTSVVVVYSHGLDAPPARLLRACRQYVRACALADRSGVPRDVISQSFGDGTYTRFSTPDWEAGRPTGYIEVDRILNSLDDYRTNFA